MKDTADTKKRSKRRHKRRSRSRPSDPPSDTSSVGEAYLDLFGPPALASTSDVYMQTYLVVQTVLKGTPWRHATTAVQAAWDAAAQHVEQSIGAAGGWSK